MMRREKNDIAYKYIQSTVVSITWYFLCAGSALGPGNEVIN